MHTIHWEEPTDDVDQVLCFQTHNDKQNKLPIFHIVSYFIHIVICFSFNFFLHSQNVYSLTYDRIWIETLYLLIPVSLSPFFNSLLKMWIIKQEYESFVSNDKGEWNKKWDDKTKRIMWTSPSQRGLISIKHTLNTLAPHKPTHS